MNVTRYHNKNVIKWLMSLFGYHLSLFPILSHFVPCQLLITPSFSHSEQYQWISPSLGLIDDLTNPWQPFWKHLISVDERVEGMVLVVASTIKARKFANSLASFGIWVGIFPWSLMKWVKLEIYIIGSYISWLAIFIFVVSNDSFFNLWNYYISVY